MGDLDLLLPPSILPSGTEMSYESLVTNTPKEEILYTQGQETKGLRQPMGHKRS